MRKRHVREIRKSDDGSKRTVGETKREIDTEKRARKSDDGSKRTVDETKRENDTEKWVSIHSEQGIVLHVTYLACAVVHAWFPKTSCNIRQQLSCGHAAPQAPTPPAAPAPAPAPPLLRCCRGHTSLTIAKSQLSWPFIGKFKWNRRCDPIRT